MAGHARAVSRYARRTDEGHAEIRDALRRMGYRVVDLSGAGSGVPDLLVEIADGVPHYLEIKKPRGGKLTDAQNEWKSLAWRVTSEVRSIEEAIHALNWAKERMNEYVPVTR